MTSRSDPRVTVLMPAYNAAPYVAQAVNSVLRQTFTDFELLVIDDGSTDDTRAVLGRCHDPRLRLELRDANAGLVVRLNEGLALARGTLIARLDADDVAHPSRLARQVEAFERDTSVTIVGGHAVNISADGTYSSMALYPETRTEVLWASCFDSPFNHSAVTFRRDAVLAQGGYDESCTYAEDYELWSRLTRAGLLGVNLPVALAAYRHHTNQMTSSRTDVKVKSNVAIIARNLDFVFPQIDHAERRAMATSIAETHFGVRPVTTEHLQRYRSFLSAFRVRFHASTFSLRRTIGLHLLGLASLAKQQMPAAGVALLLAAAGFSPEALSALVLPSRLRARLAQRAGRFWEPDPIDQSAPVARLDV